MWSIDSLSLLDKGDICLPKTTISSLNDPKLTLLPKKPPKWKTFGGAHEFQITLAGNDIVLSDSKAEYKALIEIFPSSL